MTQPMTLPNSTVKSNRSIYAALIALAVVSCIAAAVFLSREDEASAPATGTNDASSAISVPRMQNVPPPSQRMVPEVKRR